MSAHPHWCPNPLKISLQATEELCNVCKCVLSSRSILLSPFFFPDRKKLLAFFLDVIFFSIKNILYRFQIFLFFRSERMDGFDDGKLLIWIIN